MTSATKLRLMMARAPDLSDPTAATRHGLGLALLELPPSVMVTSDSRRFRSATVLLRMGPRHIRLSNTCTETGQMRTHIYDIRGRNTYLHILATNACIGS